MLRYAAIAVPVKSLPVCGFTQPRARVVYIESRELCAKHKLSESIEFSCCMADVESTQLPSNGGGDPVIDDGEEAESKVLTSHIPVEERD